MLQYEIILALFGNFSGGINATAQRPRCLLTPHLFLIRCPAPQSMLVRRFLRIGLPSHWILEKRLLQHKPPLLLSLSLNPLCCASGYISELAVLIT